MSKESLRARLSALDREILERVAERQSLALKIGEIKRERGESTRDFAREKVVIDRARATAASVGLAPDLAEELQHLLIRSSLTAQEQDRVVAEGSGAGQRALVIGGAGRMGAWMVRFLESQGYRVEVADPADPTATWSDWRDAALDHALIVVAAPLRQTNEILLALAERRPSGVVFDIGSLKTPLRTGLQALVDAGCEVTSVHPMFGPDTQLLSGSHVLFCELGRPGATAMARQLFGSTMARQVELGIDAHDRLIAYVLGLSHALNIAFLTALSRSGEAAPELLRMSSTTFDAQFGIAARVAEENPRLYFEIQRLNDFGTESLAALETAVGEVVRRVRDTDEDGFVALMQSGRDYVRQRTSA